MGFLSRSERKCFVIRMHSCNHWNSYKPKTRKSLYSGDVVIACWRRGSLKSTAIFWVVTQLVVAISGRRFGTTLGSHLQGSRIQKIWPIFYVLLTVHLCILHTRQSSTQNNKYQVSHQHNCFSWWWTHSRPKHVEIDKYTKNKFCTKLALFTRWDL